MYYVSPYAPFTADRALQRIIATLNSAQTDKDKLKTIQTLTEAWFYGKKEPHA